MKKITLLTAFFVAVTGFSQSSKQKIQTYLDNNREKLRLTTQDVSDWVIESEVPGSGTGITSTYVVQRHQGIEVFNAQSNVWIKGGSVLNMESNFRANVASRVNTTTPNLTVLQAIASAYAKLGVTKSPNFSIVETLSNKSFKLNDGIDLEEIISAKLVYQTTKENQLNLAWGFQFYSPANGDLLDLRVDALTGAILEKNNLTISCNFGNHDHLASEKKAIFSFEKSVWNNSKAITAAAPGTPGQYRVIPYNYTSPNHSPFELITTTGNLLACPNGWHDSNTLVGTNTALKFTYTRGNNVWAKSDPTGDNETTVDPNVDGTAALTFDFAYGLQTSLPTTYTRASTTNLFYMNNIMHDVWYQYGFTEAAGNFQKDNYGRQGTAGAVNSATGDYVFADAQDGYSQTTPTLNNANFSTPNDGSRPRMQMFLWNAGAPPTDYITVNGTSPLAGPMTATTNIFEGTDRIPVPLAPNGITADLVHYTNAPNPAPSNALGIHNACLAPTNAFDIPGKIALIRRGNCFFNGKVKAAQDANAVAVIIYDTIPNNPQRLSMSSTGLLGITIPAVFISKEKGEALVAEMLNGPVNIKIEVPAGLYLYADGDFDNTIIAHEYGHGISNKLIGGPVNSGCMTNIEQMGEGWSDWFGLMMQLKAGDSGPQPRTVGTYVENQPNNGAGIRQYPYSTDMTINPLTLSGSNNADTSNTGYRYTIGEFWATVLWDLNWAYVNKYGFNADIYNGTGGNNKVMRLVLDALKLQACNTAGLISGRDLIFAAETATTAGADHDMIAEVFRRRGMGLNASSGDIALPGDQVEDFTPFPLVTFANEQFYNLNSAVRIYPNPAADSVNVRVGGLEGKINIQIVDINGRVIFEQNEEKFNIEKSINIANIQSGIYILNLKADNLNYSQKLIKN